MKSQCEVPAEHHSDDRIKVFDGSPHPITLCGYHEQSVGSERAREMLSCSWALRCADGMIHQEGGSVLKATYTDARDSASFMDEDIEDSPWRCGPHTVELAS